MQALIRNQRKKEKFQRNPEKSGKNNRKTERRYINTKKIRALTSRLGLSSTTALATLTILVEADCPGHGKWRSLSEKVDENFEPF